MMRTTEAQDANMIKALEKKISEKRRRLIHLQKSIDHWEATHKFELEIVNFSPEERKALTFRITKYKKNIGLKSSDQPQSLVEETVKFFDSEQAKIDDLGAKISAVQHRLANTEIYAKYAKHLLSQLKLPELKADLSGLTFCNSIQIDQRILDTLRNTEFHQDEIADIRAKQAILIKEARSLLRAPKMKTTKPRRENVSVKSSPEMAGVISYEAARMQAAFKSAKPALETAKTAPQRLQTRLNQIDSSITASKKSLFRIRKKASKPFRRNVAARDLPIIDMRQMLSDRRNRLVSLKTSITQAQEDINTVLTDMPPEIRTKSPDGLRRWRDNLLKLKETNAAEYKKKISSAEIQLNDFKVMCRMNQQRRSSQRKY